MGSDDVLLLFCDFLRNDFNRFFHESQFLLVKHSEHNIPSELVKLKLKS